MINFELLGEALTAAATLTEDYKKSQANKLYNQAIIDSSSLIDNFRINNDPVQDNYLMDLQTALNRTQQASLRQIDPLLRREVSTQFNNYNSSVLRKEEGFQNTARAQYIQSTLGDTMTQLEARAYSTDDIKGVERDLEKLIKSAYGDRTGLRNLVNPNVFRESIKKHFAAGLIFQGKTGVANLFLEESGISQESFELFQQQLEAKRRIDTQVSNRIVGNNIKNVASLQKQARVSIADNEITNLLMQTQSSNLSADQKEKHFLEIKDIQDRNNAIQQYKYYNVTDLESELADLNRNSATGDTKSLEKRKYVQEMLNSKVNSAKDPYVSAYKEGLFDHNTPIITSNAASITARNNDFWPIHEIYGDGSVYATAGESQAFKQQFQAGNQQTRKGLLNNLSFVDDYLVLQAANDLAGKDVLLKQAIKVTKNTDKRYLEIFSRYDGLKLKPLEQRQDRTINSNMQKRLYSIIDSPLDLQELQATISFLYKTEQTKDFDEALEMATGGMIVARNVMHNDNFFFHHGTNFLKPRNIDTQKLINQFRNDYKLTGDITFINITGDYRRFMVKYDGVFLSDDEGKEAVFVFDDYQFCR